MTYDPIFIQAMMVLFALFLLQVLMLVLGVEGPQLGEGFDLDTSVDVDLDAEADLDADVDGGVLDLFGIRGVPIQIWISMWLVGFIGVGLFVSTLLFSGEVSLIARGVAVIAGFAIARLLGRVFAKHFGGITTSSTSLENARSMKGRVTHGYAAKDRPAQVEVLDHHGGTHYFMATPQDEGDVINAGEEVLVTLVIDPETAARERRIVRI